MKILFNWHKLKEIYPDPNTPIILKTVLEGPPLDTLYLIGHIEFNQYTQSLLFTGSMIDTIELSAGYCTETILHYHSLDKYVWDYYTAVWEESDHAANIIELLGIV